MTSFATGNNRRQRDQRQLGRHSVIISSIWLVISSKANKGHDKALISFWNSKAMSYYLFRGRAQTFVQKASWPGRWLRAKKEMRGRAWKIIRLQMETSSNYSPKSHSFIDLANFLPLWCYVLNQKLDNFSWIHGFSGFFFIQFLL